MPNILAGSLNGKFITGRMHSLHVLSLVVNHCCNLSCRHCYFQADRPSDQLSNEEWLRFLQSAFSDLELFTVTFAGREIFADPQSVELLLAAVDLLRHSPSSARTELGVITNATLLQEYRSSLLSHPPDYFDVSVDGLPTLHDAVRGSGSFAKLEPQLYWLMEHHEQVWLTPTLNAATMETLPEMIGYYRNRFGARRFSVGFYVPRIYTDFDLAISQGQFNSLVWNTLAELERKPGLQDVEVIIELDHHQQPLIAELEDAEYIQKGLALSSESSIMDNGLVLTFNIARVPVGLWRSVRVSADGGWIAAEDMLDVHAYDRNATAHVREAGYDARRLYELGISGDRFRNLLQSSPQLQIAFAKNQTHRSEIDRILHATV